MKNKGFTIIEIISALAILAIVGILITASLTKTLKGVKEKGCEEFVTRVEEGACVYSTVTKNCGKNVCDASQINFLHTKGIENLQSCCEVTLGALVEGGYVKEEKDACTENEVDLSNKVIVAWKTNGEKVCKYNGVTQYGN